MGRIATLPVTSLKRRSADKAEVSAIGGRLDERFRTIVAMKTPPSKVPAQPATVPDAGPGKK
jgi:hypothetical protein